MSSDFTPERNVVIEAINLAIAEGNKMAEKNKKVEEDVASPSVIPSFPLRCSS